MYNIYSFLTEKIFKGLHISIPFGFLQSMTRRKIHAYIEHLTKYDMIRNSHTHLV